MDNMNQRQRQAFALRHYALKRINEALLAWYGRELMVMIVATLNLTPGTTNYSINVVGVTIFWRLILGIGICGGYPNSLVLVSEFATVRWRVENYIGNRDSSGSDRVI